MRRLRLLLLAMALSGTATPTLATTWGQETVRDPITGDNVVVAQPASSGSYIYRWPGKEHQVFWPFIDPNWLWFNPKSGFIAFGSDFNEVRPEQGDALKAWLESNYDRSSPPESRLDKLRWAERVYTARGMEEAFWRHFYRLMAFETGEDEAMSLAYVAKAYPLIERQLEAAEGTYSELEALYLLGEYDRRLGNEAGSAARLQALEQLEVPGELLDFKAYLLEIAAEQRSAAGAGGE